MKINSKLITKIAGVAALYAVLTILLAPISYGAIQVRIAEALTLLPFFLGSWAAVGLWIGCMFANIFGGLGLIDIIGGSALTLVAGLLTARARNIWEAGIYPVIINALGVGLILNITLQLPYWSTSFYVGIGELISVYVIGVPAISITMEKVGSIFST
ncbi:QueT transporter family protein [Acetohalobium arabaticum]|uniref:QueT transporter family protein n=1 Tax=Acetohalobium arabaticum (strain ATCC 49924 / DSM 5501 / Z-7288) TaxID=574087 RepID=D9QQD8_ACEAZ|nr:QueT transporter family protein [Acetohalobium arabaticum]ADL12729.1 protein of unknown function DUF988 [Acetohalobium arabaticum DSM 5501]